MNENENVLAFSRKVGKSINDIAKAEHIVFKGFKFTPISVNAAGFDSGEKKYPFVTGIASKGKLEIRVSLDLADLRGRAASAGLKVDCINETPDGDIVDFSKCLLNCNGEFYTISDANVKAEQ